MKRKVGIVTLFGNYNYGNRLQNYAIQEIFKKYDCHCETIVVTKPHKLIKNKIKQLFGFFIEPKVALRKKNFDHFNKKYINVRKICQKTGLIPAKTEREYNIFCVGSDQVWNPGIRKKERWNLFLQFVEQNKRMCIAPSIGVDKIPEPYRQEFAEYFKGFNFLSCREKSGACDIAELSGKPCEHIIDPTLAVTKEEWLEFSTPINIRKKYIVVFFLGNLRESLQKQIMVFAKATGYEVVELSNKSCRYYTIAPNEFVWLIENAQMVFTDSFHATAFSINMNTPFYVFDRCEKAEECNHTVSRIKSLVTLLELDCRYCEGDVAEIVEECDFSRANHILIAERKKFEQYLKRCLVNATEKTDED